MAINGYLSAADTLALADNLASVFRGVVTSLPAINALAKTAQTNILGDGATTFGLSNGDVKAALKGSLPALVNAYDLTRVWAAQSALLSALDTQVRQSLPGWSFLGTSQALHYLDAHLTRINAGAGAPVSGSSNPTAGTLTAGYNALGALPACSSGNAPRVVHSLVGASDYLESLPSGEATQVALSGSQNSYVYQITGTVPTGVTKVRLYRGLVGGATGIYFWLKDVAVTPGLAYPAITLLETDALLRQDIVPAAWMAAPVSAEFAGLWALAFSGSSQTAGIFANNSQQAALPVLMTALAMLSPGNVVLNPTNMFLGVGNPQSSGRFGQATITGSAMMSWTAGTIQAANNPAANVQGYAGSLGLQSRVTSALGAGATFSLQYTYFDAAHGWGNAQTQTVISATHVTGAVGETINIPITAGRVVQSMTVNSVSGSATMGSVVIEAAPPRSIAGPVGTGALNG